MRRTSAHSGVTLVEVLVALAVFGIVMAIAYAAINGSLRIQADQEAATTTQGKLRRVVEVMTQDLRSAVFGSITNDPYDSDNTQVSFMMLTGGAGYTVLPPESGGAFGFASQNSATVLMDNASHLVGQQVVMIDASQRQGVVLTVGSAYEGRPDEWELTWVGCRNTHVYSEKNILLFEIETTGLRYDQESETIRSTSAHHDEVPFAFDISDFRVEYIYSNETDIRTETSPHRVGGLPQRSYQEGSDTWRLQRLQFVVAAEAESRGRSVDHAYTGQVELSGTEDFRVEEIIPCA